MNECPGPVLQKAGFNVNTGLISEGEQKFDPLNKHMNQRPFGLFIEGNGCHTIKLFFIKECYHISEFIRPPTSHSQTHFF